MNSPPATLDLTAAQLRCEIVPSVGGCIAGLWCGDVAVLQPGESMTREMTIQMDPAC